MKENSRFATPSLPPTPHDLKVKSILILDNLKSFREKNGFKIFFLIFGGPKILVARVLDSFYPFVVGKYKRV